MVSTFELIPFTVAPLSVTLVEPLLSVILTTLEAALLSLSEMIEVTLGNPVNAKYSAALPTPME